MGEAVRLSADDVFVSWLPLYHDMGLIGAWLGSLYFGFPLVLMSPLAFLARPERWLRAIHRHRGTLSAAPNFAYELCLKRIDDARTRGARPDARWRCAFNGAEPVSPETMRRFAERFAALRLRREALAPVYGLAECGGRAGLPAARRAGRASTASTATRFAESGHARPAAAGRCAARCRSSPAAAPLPGHEMRIVDAAGRELPERQRGPAASSAALGDRGYYRNPEQTTRRCSTATGSTPATVAYLADGEIYLTGRVKDIIIRGGRNIYPYELEEAVGELPGMRKGCVAVFGSPDPRSGTERLVVLAETRREPAADAQMRCAAASSSARCDLIGTARRRDRAGAAAHGAQDLQRQDPPRRLPRAVRAGGAAARAGGRCWWQVARLAGSPLSHPRCGDAARRAGRSPMRPGSGCLSSRWRVPTLAVDGAPRRAPHRVALTARWRTRVLRSPASRSVCAGSSIFRPRAPCVLVGEPRQLSRRPGPVRGAARARSASSPSASCADSRVPRLFLRAGAEFVERFDVEQSVEDAARLVESCASRALAAFSPRAPSRAAPGLLPFPWAPSSRRADRRAAAARGHPRHALGAARRQLVRAARRHRRHHRRAAAAPGKRLERRGGAARCGARRNPAPLRRAGPRTASAVGLQCRAHTEIIDSRRRIRSCTSIWKYRRYASTSPRNSMACRMSVDRARASLGPSSCPEKNILNR